MTPWWVEKTARAATLMTPDRIAALTDFEREALATAARTILAALSEQSVAYPEWRAAWEKPEGVPLQSWEYDERESAESFLSAQLGNAYPPVNPHIEVRDVTVFRSAWRPDVSDPDERIRA